MDALFDSNIIIDALNKHQPAFEAIQEFGANGTALSRVSWIEILAGAKTDHLLATEAYLRGCTIVELTPDIAARAAEVRRKTRLKLPDAIIWATASITERRLITRDTNFPAHWPGIHHPYVWSNNKV
jgi:predicted nucleic acid-binding protein